jgi:acetyl esterase/lipase
VTPPGPPLPPPAHEAPLPPARPGAGGTRVLLGVPYAAIPGVRPLELDLYLPPGDGGPVPVVVFLHGGGWRLGSRHTAGPAYRGAGPTPFERVAQAGIAVASVDYRLSGEAIFPAQLHDAKAAVRWLRARAGELGIDADRIAAWGESAGGHLAELLGLVTDPALEGEVGITGPSSAVAAVAAWYAPSDVAAVAADLGADPADPATREAQLLGAPAGQVPELAAQAGPVSHVSPAAPPFLLLHGRADRLVPYVQSERLAAALEAAGADVELHLLDGADHMWLGAPDAAALALDLTTGWLQEHLAGPTEEEDR